MNQFETTNHIARIQLLIDISKQILIQIMRVSSFFILIVF